MKGGLMMEEEEVVLTPEEKLEQYGDSLLAGMLGNDDKSLLNRRLCFGQIQPEIFKDENYIIYKILFYLRDLNIVPDKDFCELYLKTNRNVIEKARKYINLEAYADIDEDKVVGYIVGVMKKFVRLQSLPELIPDNFQLTLEKYKLCYKEIRVDEIYAQARIIASEGLSIGRKTLQGYEDSVSFVKAKLSQLDGLLSKDAGSGFIDCSNDDEEESADNRDIVKIGDFGDIHELNKAYGGIYSSLFYSIVAPTKGGKSKFCAYLLHNVMVRHGNNVVAWAHEGGPIMFKAQMRALHFNYFYNRTGDVKKIIGGVTQDSIMKKTYPSKEVEQLEEASKIDLWHNESYGNLTIIDKPLNVETFIDDLKTAVELNNAKLVLIDYLQLMGTSTGRPKAERIGEAYQKLLKFAKDYNVAVISPAQFTQDFMKILSNAQDSSKVEVRTSGGESSEVIRTPDINIALYATPEDLMRKVITLLPMPSRLAAPFEKTQIYANLGTVEFASMAEQE